MTALGSLDRGPAPPPPTATPAPPADVGRASPCAPGTLPEGRVCLRVPSEDELAAARAVEVASGDAPMRGQGVSPVDRIPRRPERPADPAAYVYPVGGTGGGTGAQDGGTAWQPRLLVAGALPGIKLAVRPGEVARAVSLDHQVGPAEVLYAGDLVGVTVVTAHTVEEAGRRRTILLYLGDLDHTAPGVVQGARLDAEAELGTARTALGAGLIDVYLEARELRDGVKLEPIDPKHLRDAALAMPTDVRNVLPLRS
jgi:hypothetical protein